VSFRGKDVECVWGVNGFPYLPDIFSSIRDIDEGSERGGMGGLTWRLYLRWLGLYPVPQGDSAGSLSHRIRCPGSETWLVWTASWDEPADIDNNPAVIFGCVLLHFVVV